MRQAPSRRGRVSSSTGCWTTPGLRHQCRPGVAMPRVPNGEGRTLGVIELTTPVDQSGGGATRTGLRPVQFR